MEELEKLIEEKTKIVLNLIRTNNTADEVLKITQAFVNIANGRNLRLVPEREPEPPKRGPGRPRKEENTGGDA